MKKFVLCFLFLVNLSVFAQVGFNITPSSGCGPLDVNFDFTGSPAGITNLYYDTGDGGELYDSRNATFNYTYTQIGTYTVVMYALDAQDEIVDFATGTVTVSGATAGVENTDIPIGDPTLFYVDGDAVSVIWDFGDGNTSTEMDPEHVYADTGQYIVTATIVSTSCGTVLSTIIINVTGTNFSMDLQAACAPQDVTFTYNGTMSGVAYYYWTFGDGAEDFGPTTTTVTHNYSGGGTYPIELYLLDAAFNPIGYVTKELKLSGISITPSLNYTSPNQDIEFISGGTDGASVSWDFGDGTTSTDLNPVHSYTTAGTYTVTLTAVSPLCGSQTVEVSMVIVDYTLNVTIAAGCTSPYQVDFEVTGGGTTPVYFEWFYGDDSTAVLQSTTNSYTYTADGQYFAYVNLYDTDYNYMGTLVKEINLGVSIWATNPYPSVGEAVDFGVSGDFTSVTWDFGDSGSSTDNQPNYAYSATGTYTVTASIVTPSCGTVVKTLEMIVRDISFSLSNTGGCSPIDVTINYTGTDPDAVFFDWNFGDGNNPFGPSTSATNTYTEAGTYLVEVVAFNSVFDVLGYKTYTVTITGTTEQFDLTVIGNLDVCVSGSVVLSSPIPGTYTWSTGENSTSITVTTAGDYSLSVVNGGCTAVSNTETFSIHPLPIVNAGGDATICSGNPITLSGSGASSYSWDNGVTDGVGFPATTTTTYTVTGTDANGCENTDDITITVNPSPVITFDSLSPICVYNAARTLTALPAGGIFSGTGVSGSTFDPAGLLPGTYTISYDVTVGGCSSTATQTIAVDSCLNINTMDQAQMSIYPNPTTGKFTVSSDNLNQYDVIELRDQLGRTVGTWKINNTNMNIETKNIAKGNYLLVVRGNKGEMFKQIQLMD